VSLPCRNCQKQKDEHLEGQCLFDTTSYVEMTDKEYSLSTISKLLYRVFKDEYKNPIGEMVSNSLADMLCGVKPICPRCAGSKKDPEHEGACGECCDET
jgi:hypothetical protein